MDNHSGKVGKEHPRQTGNNVITRLSHPTPRDSGKNYDKQLQTVTDSGRTTASSPTSAQPAVAAEGRHAKALRDSRHE